MTKKVSEMSPDEIKMAVRDTYAGLAGKSDGDCGCGPPAAKSSCCGPPSESFQESKLKEYGYSIEGLPASLTESNGSCGNPLALASLKEGETVLDLGSGAGLDAFFASQKVGESGKVIGIDMTPEMLEKARKNIDEMGVTNIEFRQGDIEALSVEDSTIDVIISNCVINLAPNKAAVFKESYRVLKPGGRMMVSDIVLKDTLPDSVRDEVASYTGCIGGAIPEEEYLQLMRDAGFIDVHVAEKAGYDIAVSAKIAATKPL
ncbi:MAG: arsenite methyltransferase [Candidatus Thorarchaeota archaeon]|nr:arsenite methyltransferase [Candidatus Thorarchaeota archaeon]